MLSAPRRVGALSRASADPPRFSSFTAENGYGVVARFLRGDGGKRRNPTDVPGVSKRAEADALAVVASGARESSRAAGAPSGGARAVDDAADHQLTSRTWTRGSEERVSRRRPIPGGPLRVSAPHAVSLTDPFLRDREVRDRLAAVASAFSVLKRAERARERGAARADPHRPGRVFVDVTRLLPRTFRTRASLARRGGVRGDAHGVPGRGQGGGARVEARGDARGGGRRRVAAGAGLRGEGDAATPSRTSTGDPGHLADRENRGDAKHGHLLPRTRTAKRGGDARWSAPRRARGAREDEESERGGGGGGRSATATAVDVRSR